MLNKPDIGRVERINGVEERLFLGESHHFLQEDLLEADKDRREDEVVNVTLFLSLVIIPVEETVHIELLSNAI